MDFDCTLFETSASRKLRAVKGSKKDWDAIYACIPQFRLYDGWEEVLKYIQRKDISLAIVSAAKAELIEKTLTHFGIEYGAIVGYQRYIKKPSPRLMEMALKRLNLRPDEVIYIGDSKEDVELSLNSRIQFFGALWDSADRDYLLAHSMILNRPDDIFRTQML